MAAFWGKADIGLKCGKGLKWGNVRAMGIWGKTVEPASPWPNGFAERLIGSTRREVWTISSSGAKHICAGFCNPTARYYNDIRTHAH